MVSDSIASTDVSKSIQTLRFSNALLAASRLKLG